MVNLKNILVSTTTILTIITSPALAYETICFIPDKCKAYQEIEQTFEKKGEEFSYTIGIACKVGYNKQKFSTEISHKNFNNFLKDNKLSFARTNQKKISCIIEEDLTE